VAIPVFTTKHEILSWSLDQFQNYFYQSVEYLPDKQEFVGLPGYCEYIAEHNISIDWWNSAIWQSPAIPGYWLVNFSTEMFHIFVENYSQNFETLYETLDPVVLDCIHKFSPALKHAVLERFLTGIFRNRGLSYPKSFKRAWQRIQHAGLDNLLEYSPDFLLKSSCSHDVHEVHEHCEHREPFDFRT
jgi:hypothetical protein